MNEKQEQDIVGMRKKLSEMFHIPEEKVADMINDEMVDMAHEQKALSEVMFMLSINLENIKKRNQGAFHASFVSIFVSLVATYIKPDRLHEFLMEIENYVKEYQEGQNGR